MADKQLISGRKCWTVSQWWTTLSQEEQDALITMMYNMSVEDFNQHGIFIKDDRYELKVL